MKRIKLNSLADNSLKNKQMNYLRGGNPTSGTGGTLYPDCPNHSCGCIWEGTPGGWDVKNLPLYFIFIRSFLGMEKPYFKPYYFYKTTSVAKFSP